jgi:hypothetical protein
VVLQVTGLFYLLELLQDMICMVKSKRNLICGEIQTRIVLNDEIFEILLNFLAVIKFLSSQTCLGQ